MSTDWVLQLKVTELKEELQKRGQPTKGLKNDLQDRLITYINEHEADEVGATGAVGAQEADSTSDSKSPFTSSDDETAVEGMDAVIGNPPAGAMDGRAHKSALPGSASSQGRTRRSAKQATPESAAIEEAPEPEPKAEPEPEPEAEPTTAGSSSGSDNDGGAAVADAGTDTTALPAKPAETQETAAPTDEKTGTVPEPITSPDAKAAPADGSLAALDATMPAAVPAEEVMDLDYGEDDGAAGTRPVHDEKEAARSAKRSLGGDAVRKEPQRKRGPGAAAPDSGADARRLLVASADGDAAALAAASAGPAGPSRALRIDGFVRPFTERAVRELLDGSGLSLKALWMPSIKTHCYAVFGDRQAAAAAAAATDGLRWPSASPKTLAPQHVALVEAERAIGAGAGNPEFRVPRTAEDEEPEGVAAAAVAEAEAVVSSGPGSASAAAAVPLQGDTTTVGPKSADHATAAAPGRIITGTATETASAPVHSGREWDREKKVAQQQAEKTTGQPVREGMTDLRELLSNRRKSGGGAEEGKPVAAAEEEEKVLTLDDLFRRTKTEPALYWLPLTPAEPLAAVADNESDAHRAE